MTEPRTRRSLSADPSFHRPVGYDPKKVYGRPSCEERGTSWQKRQIPHNGGTGLGLLHWQAPNPMQSSSASSESYTPRVRTPSVSAQDSPRFRLATNVDNPPISTALPPRPPGTPRAHVAINGNATPLNANAAPAYASSTTSGTSSRDGYARRRSLDSNPACPTPRESRTPSRRTPMQGSASRPPLSARSRSGPPGSSTPLREMPLNWSLSRKNSDPVPEAPPSPRSPRYVKTPEKIAYLDERMHPFRGKPRPAAPPRIAGYSGHRPGAREPVGLNFNRFEMKSSEEYGENVTYESLTNPAFASWVKPPEQRKVKPKKPEPKKPNIVPYVYQWQQPKNPITGHPWYTASGDPPPPLYASQRVAPPIGHPDRFDFIPDDPVPNTIYPNMNSVFATFSPFDID